MIGKVQRGADCGGLVAYLFGPGRHNEHTDQHVVAHWTGLPGEVVAVGADGQPDLAPLVADLKADLRAAGLLGAEGSVWHCSVAIPATDGTLHDAQWREVAEAIAEAVGLEDEFAGAVRWVAVRHGLSAAGNDHIHLVATLAGRTQHGDVADRSYLNRDYAQVREVCNRFEKAWGLTVTGKGTRAAHHEPSRAETEIAARRGLRTEQRVHLERAVRTAAVASAGQAEFAARLASRGHHRDVHPGVRAAARNLARGHLPHRGLHRRGRHPGGVLRAHVGPGPVRPGVAGPVGRPRHRPAGRADRGHDARPGRRPGRGRAGRHRHTTGHLARADRRRRGRAVGGRRRRRG